MELKICQTAGLTLSLIGRNPPFLAMVCHECICQKKDFRQTKNQIALRL